MSAFTFSMFIGISLLWIAFLTHNFYFISLTISAADTCKKLKLFPITAFLIVEKLGWF